ncbi:hypothetical protein BST97_02365 [Nonlabens spongiae]|uniref:Uracil-DNA glycosylase-like domain-containing protein n=1 Tax=Nonlabens spongiae TaxID=331648 RepID=A0A1W6MH51_9FLAO|nr:hypothetical protein [Nonlabens spongiae]ARN76933.1 hypothetical protein BST97_02365 [Nonlabens spongiae]
MSDPISHRVEIASTYRDDILKIWNDFKQLDIFDEEHVYRKYPLAPDSIKKHQLTFIGINPSFNKKHQVHEDEKPIWFYPNDFKVDDNSISYFKKFQEVADYCEAEWTHLDLLFLRETNQKLIENLTYSNIDFIQKQLDISFEILEKAKPKLIVVANAYASEFFGKKKFKHYAFDKIWRGHDFVFNDNPNSSRSNFNEDIGTYEIQLNGKKTPILFCGMLSGQRALDLGSFERLKWQVKMILQKL